MGPSLEESVTLLPEYSDCENGETNDKLYKGHVAERARDRHSTGYLYALVLIVIIVDLVVYGAIAYDAATERFIHDKVDHLEIRNSYVGLDELYASGLVNSSHLPSILNLPRVVGQVYQNDPLRLSPQDEHLWLTPYGAMAPPDRHLQVSDNVHTIYQFRTIDFGMERCQLAMRLPELGDTTTGPLVVQGDSDSVAVEVCETDMSRPLDLWHLSWRNRPICRKHVGTFVGVPGQEVTLPEFPCKWNELHTYEVSCANTGCILDVWSNQNLTWGIFLYQHQTI